MGTPILAVTEGSPRRARPAPVVNSTRLLTRESESSRPQVRAAMATLQVCLRPPVGLFRNRESKADWPIDANPCLKSG